MPCETVTILGPADGGTGGTDSGGTDGSTDDGGTTNGGTSGGDTTNGGTVGGTTFPEVGLTTTQLAVGGAAAVGLGIAAVALRGKDNTRFVRAPAPRRRRRE